jgi:hypothetical protein
LRTRAAAPAGQPIMAAPSVPSAPEDWAEVIRRELGPPAHTIQPLPDPVTADYENQRQDLSG